MKERQSQIIPLLIVFFVPVLIASLIRFWDLDLRPFHSDEGVNSHFLINLYKTGYYRYDPSNYHGPFLYYIGLIPTYILGFTDFSFRLLPVLFGIMTVALLYPLRKRFGAMGLLTAGVLVVLSLFRNKEINVHLFRSRKHCICDYDKRNIYNYIRSLCAVFDYCVLF